MDDNWWHRDTPQHFNFYERPWIRLEGSGLFAGLPGRLLSRDPDTGSETLMIRLEAQWRADEIAPVRGCVEIFVLDGEILIDGKRIGPSGFIAVPAGQAVNLGSGTGALVLAFVNPTLDVQFYYGGSTYAVQGWELPWNLAARPGEAPLMPGTTNAGLYKSLRPVDSNDGRLRGGPNGFLRLFYFVPGYGFPRHDVHFESWEEVLFLLGECFMGDRGLMGPGSYVRNPAGMLHGPLMSQRGSLMLIHNGSAQDFETVDSFPHAEEMTQWFLEHTSLYAEPLTTNWEQTAAYEFWADSLQGQEVAEFPQYLPAPNIED